MICPTVGEGPWDEVSLVLVRHLKKDCNQVFIPICDENRNKWIHFPIKMQNKTDLKTVVQSVQHNWVGKIWSSSIDRFGFFKSDAPTLFKLDSWDVTSQKVYAMKLRGWVTQLVRGGCYLALSPVKGEHKLLLFFGVHNTYQKQINSLSQKSLIQLKTEDNILGALVAVVQFQSVTYIKLKFQCNKKTDGLNTSAKEFFK